ncbi:flagellar motor protein MotB [Methylobacterium komagatae]|uniref:Flagellar motor protein MotB n=1 Tax=Methylobacterium komagatae TaxID=374425 RepID=A0ABW2BND2_9HYPH
MATIIVKKVKKGHHGHHGGAWKIAYADFVTAMMAFFLLMWLISMTTQEQKIGLAEYFAPSTLSRRRVAQVACWRASPWTSRATSRPRPATRRPAPPIGATARARRARAAPATSTSAARMPACRRTTAPWPVSGRRFRRCRTSTSLSHNILIEPTKDGVNVSLVDENGRSMFRDGSVQPYEHTRRVLQAIAPTLRQLPNRLTITGHTSTTRPGAAPAAEPWTLTAGRALAVREILAGAGVRNDNFSSVAGRADTEPVFPDDPYIASNRRVTITLLNSSPPAPPNLLR